MSHGLLFSQFFRKTREATKVARDVLVPPTDTEWSMQCVIQILWSCSLRMWLVLLTAAKMRMESSRIRLSRPGNKYSRKQHYVYSTVLYYFLQYCFAEYFTMCNVISYSGWGSDALRIWLVKQNLHQFYNRSISHILILYTILMEITVNTIRDVLVVLVKHQPYRSEKLLPL